MLFQGECPQFLGIAPAGARLSGSMPGMGIPLKLGLAAVRTCAATSIGRTDAFPYGKHRQVIGAHSRIGVYGISAPSQSALMPTNLITLPHFSVSAAIK